MNSSPDSARNAQDTTIKQQKEKMASSSSEAQEPEGKELISGLSAGTSATPMVEVTSEVSPSSTVALAAAVRQTGFDVIEDSGPEDLEEYETGNYLPKFDFSSAIDHEVDGTRKWLKRFSFNPPDNSKFVANKLIRGKKSAEGHLIGVKREANLKSRKYNIGEGVRISIITENSTGFKKKRCLMSERKPWNLLLDRHGVRNTPREL